MSWNQVSGLGLGIRCLGITCLGIRCPELILESGVLESGVQICFGIRCLGITRPQSHVWESGVHFSLGIKCHWESHVLAHLETSVVWNRVSGDRYPESNVRDTNVSESNETHPPESPKKGLLVLHRGEKEWIHRLHIFFFFKQTYSS